MSPQRRLLPAARAPTLRHVCDIGVEGPAYVIEPLVTPVPVREPAPEPTRDPARPEREQPAEEPVPA